MKKIFLIIAACTLSMGMMAQVQNKVVKVRTAQEFLSAIDNNTTIEVCVGEMNITPALEELAERGAIPEGGYATVAKDTYVEPGMYWYNPYDGPNLCLVGVNNIVIKGSGNGSRILVSPRYADVITFARCSGVKLENVTMGHTDSGYCENGVLTFNGCYDVTIKDCDLFGCGTEGLILDGTNKFCCENTVIHDCEYDLMTIKESNDVLFNNCQLIDTGTDFSSIGVGEVNIEYDQGNIEFRDCTFSNNEGMLFNISSKVTMTNCTIDHPQNMIGNTEYIEFK